MCIKIQDLLALRVLPYDNFKQKNVVTGGNLHAKLMEIIENIYQKYMHNNLFQTK